MFAGNASIEQIRSKVTKVDLLSDLKSLVPSPGDKVYLTGRTTIGDQLGGFYYWDPTSIDPEDTLFMNVIPAFGVVTGRWIRSFQKARQYPQGTTNPGMTMVVNGGVKTLYINTVVSDSNGDATVYLTDTGVASGNALFTEIWFHDVRANSPSSTPSTGVSSYFKSLSTDLKTLVYGQFKPNPVTITVGLVYAPVSAAPASTPVLFKIEGL